MDSWGVFCLRESGGPAGRARRGCCFFGDWGSDAESVGFTRLHGGLLFVSDNVLIRGLVAWLWDACVLALSVCCFVLPVCFVCFVCLVACVLF